MMTQRQTGIAAEAFAAGIFAVYGWDIFVQYGANQPGYDFVATKDKKTIKVSIKGSKDGSWGLTQSHLTKGAADYLMAADKWLSKHDSDIIFCFVQFKDLKPKEMPRMYIAAPKDIADALKAAKAGTGDTILYEYPKTNRQGVSYASIPSEWEISSTRIDELL